ncbi:MAG: 3'-5' exonuclease [Proteobacteria bacterium]|nr:3'-5' exonuclease [Pseudomonadota bacterium]MBU1737576.1 3'-5' exonuclease [Pseudomonadota bacterium]
MDFSKIAKLFGRKSTGVHPLIARSQEYFRNFNKDLPLQDYDFVVFDTELSGFDLNKDEIVAIGAVKIRNLQIQCACTFYSLVRPEKDAHTPSTLIHRLTPGKLIAARPLAEVLPEFIDFCGEAVQIGHYTRLDLDFINKATTKLFGGALKTPYLDTMRLAMAYNESKHGHYYDHSNIHGAYTLNALSREFNLPIFTEHNALQDSLQTAYLFLFLVKKMREYGFRTLNDYLKAGRKWKIIL